MGTYNQTVKITEDGDSFSNDPGNDPASNAQTNPDTDWLEVALVNQAGLGAEAEVDVLQTNMSIDDTSTDNLISCY